MSIKRLFSDYSDLSTQPSEYTVLADFGSHDSQTIPYLSQSSMPSSSRSGKRSRRSSKSSRSYKRSYSMYKRPSPYALIYPIERRAQYVCIGNPSVGFKDLVSGQTSYYLGFTFSLEGVQPWLATNAQAEQPLPSSSELQSLFDRYRLKRVIVTVYYSLNSAETGQYPMPVLKQALDFNQVTGTNDLNEYAGSKFVQLGNVVNGCRFNLTTPTCSNAVETNTAPTANLAQSAISPWIDTASPGVNHYGMRFQLGYFGNAAAADVGNFLFSFRLEYEFKNPR